MTQTAEAGADNISQVIARMRELAVESSNGSLTSTDRGLLDTEFQALKEEIDRLSDATEFNGTELLAGKSATVSFQVAIGTTTNDRIDIAFGGVGTTALGVEGLAVTGSDATNATAAITALDSALTSVSTTRARFGAASNRLTFALTNSESIRFNLSAADSAIRETDLASETASLARHQVMVKAGTSVLAQANVMPSYALTLLESGA